MMLSYVPFVSFLAFFCVPFFFCLAHAQSLECRALQQQTTCDDWKEDAWQRPFVRRATLNLIRTCLDTGQVNINHPIGHSGTLLIHLARAPGQSTSMANEGDDHCHETPGHILALTDFILENKDRYGLDLDAKDRSGRTALHYALGNGAAWPIAVRLLDAGADPLAVSNERRAWAFRQDYWQEFHGAAERLIGNVGNTKELRECRTVDCFVDGLLSR